MRLVFRVLAIVALLVSVGCADQIEIEPMGSDEDTELVEQAAAEFGLSVVWGTGPMSISVALVDGCGPDYGLPKAKCGLALEAKTLQCHDLWVLSERDAAMVTHELGHALGLAHSHGGAMAPSPKADGGAPTDEQLDAVQRRARFCWG